MERKKKKRNGLSWANLGRSWRTPAHDTLEGRIGNASIQHWARPPRRDADTQRETLATLGPIGSSPGGGGGRWRWSRKVEAGQGRAAAVSWVADPHLGLHAGSFASELVTFSFPMASLVHGRWRRLQAPTGQMEDRVRRSSSRGTRWCGEEERRSVAAIVVSTTAA
jgi:hypothetical protein